MSKVTIITKNQTENYLSYLDIRCGQFYKCVYSPYSSYVNMIGQGAYDSKSVYLTWCKEGMGYFGSATYEHKLFRFVEINVEIREV